MLEQHMLIGLIGGLVGSGLGATMANQPMWKGPVSAGGSFLLALFVVSLFSPSRILLLVLHVVVMAIFASALKMPRQAATQSILGWYLFYLLLGGIASGFM